MDYDAIIIGSGAGTVGINPSLSTWKPIGLTARVRSSGLPRTEAGLQPDTAKQETAKGI